LAQREGRGVDGGRKKIMGNPPITKAIRNNNVGNSGRCGARLKKKNGGL